MNSQTKYNRCFELEDLTEIDSNLLYKSVEMKGQIDFNLYINCSFKDYKLKYSPKISNLVEYSKKLLSNTKEVSKQYVLKNITISFVKKINLWASVVEYTDSETDGRVKSGCEIYFFNDFLKKVNINRLVIINEINNLKTLKSKNFNLKKENEIIFENNNINIAQLSINLKKSTTLHKFQNLICINLMHKKNINISVLIDSTKYKIYYLRQNESFIDSFKKSFEIVGSSEKFQVIGAVDLLKNNHSLKFETDTFLQYIPEESNVEFKDNNGKIGNYLQNSIFTYFKKDELKLLENRIIYSDLKIDENGKVYTVEIKNGINSEIDNKLKEILSNTKWYPQKIGKNSIKSEITIPINF